MQKGILYTLGTAIISGVAIFLNAYGVKGLNPFAFTGTKNLLVAILLLSVLLSSNKRHELKSLSSQQWRKLVLIGLLGGSIPFLLFFKGLSMGSGVSGAFIHKTMIVWVSVGALLYLKERPKWQLLIGAALLLLGNALVMQLASITIGEGSGYIFLATLFWSAEILLSKKMLKNISSTTVASARMGFGTIIIFLYLLIAKEPVSWVTWNLQTWGWVIVTSALLFGYIWTFYKGLVTIQASTAVAILSFGAVITTCLQLLIGKVAITTLQGAGFFLLMTGMMFIFWYQQKTVFHGARSTA